MEIFKTDFFDILTIQNDQISYVKHALAPFHVGITPFGCGGAGDGELPRGLGHNLLLCCFLASAAQKRKFLKLIFFLWPSLINYAM